MTAWLCPQTSFLSVATFVGGKIIVSTDIKKLLDVALTNDKAQTGTTANELSLRISFLVKKTPHHKLVEKELSVTRDDREEAEKWIKTALTRAYSG